MPEGPEVRLIAEQLDRISGKFLLEVVKNESSRYFEKKFSGEADLLGSLPLQIISITCKGKLLIFTLSKGWILSTLGMEGRWIWRPEHHSGICLGLGSVVEFPGGNFVIQERDLFYDDSRQFGSLRYVTSQTEFEDKLKTLGPDILDSELVSQPNEVEWVTMLRKRNRQMIAKVLLDQSVACGIGNYVRSECLYLAEVSPYTLIRDLSDETLVRIRRAAASVLVKSYRLGGFTLKSFHSADGSVGKYVPVVYGRKTDDLGKKVTRLTFDGRVVWTTLA